MMNYPQPTEASQDATQKLLERYAFFRTMKCNAEAETTFTQIQQAVTCDATLKRVYCFAVAHKSFSLMKMCADHALEINTSSAASRMAAARHEADLVFQAGALQKEVIALRAQLSEEQCQRHQLERALAESSKRFHFEEQRLKSALKTLVGRMKQCATAAVQDRGLHSDCGGDENGLSHSASYEHGSEEVGTQTKPVVCQKCMALGRQLRAAAQQNRQLSSFVLSTLQQVRQTLERRHSTPKQKVNDMCESSSCVEFVSKQKS